MLVIMLHNNDLLVSLSAPFLFAKGIGGQLIENSVILFSDHKKAQTQWPCVVL